MARQPALAEPEYPRRALLQRGQHLRLPYQRLAVPARPHRLPALRLELLGRRGGLPHHDLLPRRGRSRRPQQRGAAERHALQGRRAVLQCLHQARAGQRQADAGWKDSGFKQAYLVGPCFSQYNDNSDYLTFPKVEDLVDYLEKHPVEGRTILVKGSRGIQLEKVLPLIQ